MLLNSARRLRLFTISPRTKDLSEYWADIKETIRCAAKYDFEGVLLFTGNDTYIEPWFVAYHTLATTDRLSPLVAVNPVYMHPYTVAKMISSLTYVFTRKIYVNMVIGTAVSYLESLGDHLDHDQRYERLAEYMLIVRLLLNGPKLVSHTGKYYSISNLQGLPAIPATLTPEFFLAGQSKAALDLCRGATSMRMLPLDLSEFDGEAVHCGFVTRPNDADARDAAMRLFGVQPEMQEVLDYAMQNTEAVWKHQLRSELNSVGSAILSSGYWMGPFQSMRADCPYVVGSYERVADIICSLAKRGTHTVILDIAAREEEYHHVSAAFSLGERLIRSAAGNAIGS